jgi:hypothetical protein
MINAWIGKAGHGLALRAEDRDGYGAALSVDATMQMPGLEARCLVSHHFANGFEELVDFLAGLERDWKGWIGPRTFSSLEGELTLTATHTGRQIDLEVRLRQSTVPGGWDVAAILPLEPGEQLSRVVSDVREALTLHP